MMVFVSVQPKYPLLSFRIVSAFAFDTELCKYVDFDPLFLFVSGLFPLHPFSSDESGGGVVRKDRSQFLHTFSLFFLLRFWLFCSSACCSR